MPSSTPLAPEIKHNIHTHTTCCVLCGLSLRYGSIRAEFSGKPYFFCCMGCRQVFSILLEATDSGDPAKFQETDLFKQCQAAGIIPKSEADLAVKASARELEDPALATAGQADASEKASAISVRETLSLSLKIVNMWCPACAWLIDETLKKTTGIVDSSCNFSTDRLQIHYHPVQTSPTQIIRTIDKLGYRATLPDETQDSKDRKKEFIRFAVSAFLTMNVMMLSFALYSGFFTRLTPDTIYKLSWPACVMATVVLIYGGFEFFKKAWSGLTNAAFSMETLIIIGSLSAYTYSTINLFSGSIHLYYDTSAMLITLVLLGKTLERRAKGRVLADLENFFSLKPNKVRICSDEFPQGRYAAVGQLEKNDIFRVDDTEIIPADGRIITGTGQVDESSLTGEPLPITKKPGDILKSGARVIRGTLKIKAEKVGHESTLGQMIAIIEKTLLTKTPLEGKTDVILQWFVPAIMAISAATALVCILLGISAEESMLRAVTVLVISCPCALGISIPLARVAGISIAGKKGILVRDFSAFELAEKVNAFVFDKTGTVTEGKWNLLEIRPVSSISADRALALAAGLEMNSDHFIAREILQQSHRRKIQPAHLEKIRIKERGLKGELDSVEIKIGSADFLAEEFENSDPPSTGKEHEEGWRHSSIYLSLAGKLVAVFIFGDRLRTGSIPVVEKLKEWGYHLTLISGDGEKTTKAVGDMIGIADAYGGKLPQAKAAFVQKLQKHGSYVAMVGDGLNDAPALVQADLSIAVFSGGQLSQEASDITLMRAEPEQIIDFLNFAKQVNKKIYQNLAFTFLYNVISIPIAMSGLLNPLVAVTAMLMSSLSVTGNVLLLLKKNT